MVHYGIMSVMFTALAATRHCAAFNVVTNLKSGRSALARTFSKSTSSLAASDNDFDDFSAKVSFSEDF